MWLAYVVLPTLGVFECNVTHVPLSPQCAGHEHCRYCGTKVQSPLCFLGFLLWCDSASTCLISIHHLCASSKLLFSDLIKITGKSLEQTMLNRLRASVLKDTDVDLLIPIMVCFVRHNEFAICVYDTHTHTLLLTCNSCSCCTVMRQYNKPADLAHELDACKALLRICENMLSLIPSSNQDDTDLLQQPSTSHNVRAALQIRIGERSILQEQVKTSVKYWDSLLLTGMMEGGVAVDPMASVFK
jgi:hypothetical protein